MSREVPSLNLSPEEILSDIHDPVDYKIVNEILTAFVNNGLTYKVRKEYQPRERIENPGYRIFCYIKKSKEALIINTKGWHYDSVCLQIRVLNTNTFDKLNEYSETMRNSILNARECNKCGEGCSRLSYVFNYNGINYDKCHMLCDVFSFRSLAGQDIPSVMDIIQREIDFGKPKRK